MSFAGTPRIAHQPLIGFSFDFNDELGDGDKIEDVLPDDWDTNALLGLYTRYGVAQLSKCRLLDYILPTTDRDITQTAPGVAEDEVPKKKNNRKVMSVELDEDDDGRPLIPENGDDRLGSLRSRKAVLGVFLKAHYSKWYSDATGLPSC